MVQVTIIIVRVVSSFFDEAACFSGSDVPVFSATVVVEVTSVEELIVVSCVDVVSCEIIVRVVVGSTAELEEATMEVDETEEDTSKVVMVDV